MPFARDTSPEARAAVLARLGAMSPTERLAATADLVRVGLQLARLGARESTASRSEPELHALFLRRWLGGELAEAVIAEVRRRSGNPA